MSKLSYPFGCLLIAILHAPAAEVTPPIPIPEPVPTAVREAAQKLAKPGQIQEFSRISSKLTTYYQVHVISNGNVQEMVATFTSEGELVSLEPLLPTKEEIPPVIPPPEPLPTPEPRRLDGRDADPASRIGVDPTDPHQ